MGREAIKSALERYFRDVPIPLVCAYLYGSLARSEERPESDVDVAVLLAEQTDGGLLSPIVRLRGELERSLHRTVDLIDLRSAPVDLIHRVMRDGVLLVERDPSARVHFEVDARNRYFDLLPHLQRYRRERAA